MSVPKEPACKYGPYLFLIAALLLGGCAGAPQAERILAAEPEELARERELKEVPFFPQERYQCGPAALATVLRHSGVEITPEELVPRVYLPERQGSLQVEMVAAARQAGRIAYPIAPSLNALLREIQGGHPVLVLQNLGLSWLPTWHYAVAVGYHLKDAHVVLRSGTVPRRLTPLRAFENTWRRSSFWGVILLRPGELPATGNPRDYFLAVSDFAASNPADQALTAYAAGAGRWPESEALGMAVGNLHYHRNDLASAARAYRRVLTANNDYAPAHNNLAQVLHELGDDDALIHARRAVALGGPHAEQYRDTLKTIRQGP